MENSEGPGLIPPHGGYRGLRSYQIFLKAGPYHTNELQFHFLGRSAGLTALSFVPAPGRLNHLVVGSGFWVNAEIVYDATVKFCDRLEITKIFCGSAG